MRYTTHINNSKCLEWGLNANQGALFDLLNQASSWAKPLTIDGEVFFWVARQKVIEELPLFYAKEDTVYRHFLALTQKELIEYKKIGEKDLIRLTEKGKTWNEFNSEMNPTLGNESEETRISIRNSSEIDPTYNNTNYNNTNNNISTSQQVAPKKKQTIKFSDEDMAVAEYFVELIKNISPNFKQKSLGKWANEIRLMREQDEHSHEDIRRLFHWANSDEFWQKNILSPSKLRKNWVQLELKSQENHFKPKGTAKFSDNPNDNSWAKRGLQ